MNLFTKRFGLVLAGVVGVGAIAALAVGASFALFTSTANGPSQTFTAGTVRLNTTATGTCTGISNLEPGDSGTCAFTVTYAGSLDAYIGARVVSASEGSLLGSELQFALNDHPTNGTTPVLIGSGRDRTYTATLAYRLPSGAGNTYQGLSTTLSVVFYAVQCSNNGLLADGTLDLGTNATCADPGPASWTETPANAPASSNFSISSNDGTSGFSPSTVAPGGTTGLGYTVYENGYYPDATVTVTWPTGDLSFTGNGDTSALCTSNASSVTCTYTDFAHGYKSDTLNFTVGSGVSGAVPVTITITGFGGQPSTPAASATATDTLNVS